jgi:hypothetical protein
MLQKEVWKLKVIAANEWRLRIHLKLGSDWGGSYCDAT